jgi:hypothetical protein
LFPIKSKKEDHTGNEESQSQTQYQTLDEFVPGISIRIDFFVQRRL